MTKPNFFFILIVLFVISSIPSIAQETEEDPYSDYSYLWEDSKEKEKEEKRKAKEEKKRQKELEKMRKKGLLPEASDPLLQDTTKNEESVSLDSLKKPTLDSIQNVSPDTLDIPTDSLEPSPKETPVEEEYELEDEETEEEPKKEKVKKEKEKKSISGPPVEDFRSGMGSTDGGGSFNGGFTFTLIDGQYYAGMVLNPEFNLGKVGIGLNVPILYGLEDKSIRTEIFKDGVGIARLITYIRLGVQKNDPVYVKVGQLNNTMIGFGGLVNNYTNTTSFEKRKVGLHYDFNVKGLVGIDGLYSDFNPGSLNLLAVRPYVRPLAWSGLPVVRTIEFGATIIKDKDQTNLGIGDSTSTYNFTKEGIGAYGLDMGITLFRAPFIQIDLFANYTKLDLSSQALTDSLESIYTVTNEPTAMSDGFQDGTGASVGLNFRFHFIADLLSTDVRIERLNYTDHYLPQFFDATYELNKDAKIFQLGGAEKMSGIYGSLTGHILKKIQLGGSLMIPDNISETSPAMVRVNADAERIADKFTLQASYIKGNLTNLNDAFTFDENSLAKVRFIYHLNKFLAAGVDYFWAFTPTPEGEYVATKYISPYFGVNIAF